MKIFTVNTDLSLTKDALIEKIKVTFYIDNYIAVCYTDYVGHKYLLFFEFCLYYGQLKTQINGKKL